MLSIFFDDLSWDGMTRAEMFTAFQAGWNPVLDSLSDLREKLVQAGLDKTVHEKITLGFQLSFGNYLSGYLNLFLGDPNCGKAVTPILTFTSFCLAVGAFSEIVSNKKVLYLFSVVAAFNPVSIYQSSSFYIDSQVGSLYLCLVSGGLRLLLSEIRLDKALICGVSFFALSGAKVSGLFYGIVVAFFLALFVYFTQTKNKGQLVFCFVVGACVVFPVTWVIRKNSKFHQISLQHLFQITNINSRSIVTGKQIGRAHV